MYIHICIDCINCIRMLRFIGRRKNQEIHPSGGMKRNGNLKISVNAILKMDKSRRLDKYFTSMKRINCLLNSRFKIMKYNEI